MDPEEFTVQRAVRSGDDIRIEDIEIVRVAQKFQIINIGDFCNECGNCTTFCPTNGAPYRVKPKFYLTPQTLESEQNGYLLIDGVLKAKVDGELETLSQHADHLIYETKDIRAQLNIITYCVEEATFHSEAKGPVNFRHAAQMAILFTALKDLPIFA
jgi:putative selenate reductase